MKFLNSSNPANSHARRKEGFIPAWNAEKFDRVGNISFTTSRSVFIRHSKLLRNSKREASGSFLGLLDLILNS